MIERRLVGYFQQMKNIYIFLKSANKFSRKEEEKDWIPAPVVKILISS